MLNEGSGHTIKRLFPGVNLKSLVSFVIAMVFLTFFLLSGILKINAPSTILIVFYSLGNLFLLWTIFELFYQRNPFYLLFLFFMGLPLVNFMIVNNSTWGLPLKPFIINYTLIVTFVLLIRVLFNNKIKIRYGLKVLLPFTILLLLSIISIVNSKNTFISINAIIFGLIIPLFVYIILVNFINRRKDVVLIYELLVIVLLFYNVLSFIFELISESGITNRMAGLFWNPNFYAPILLVGSFLSLYLVYHYKVNTNKYNLVYIFSFIFCIYLLLSVGSRTVVGALLVGMLLFYLQLPRTNKKIIVPIGITILLFLIIWFIDIGAILQNSSFSTIQRVFSIFEEGMDDERSFIWSDSWNYILDNKLYFIGIGYGVMLFEEIGWTTPHNSFLYLSVTIGILGSIIYHLLIITNIGLRNLLKKDITTNIAGIIVIVLLLQWNITGNRFALYPLSEYEPNMSVFFDVILLWALIGISYASRKYIKE
ncbi:O-antigen ligase family protein [Alkalihalobacillus sp. LMS39]|uniref:O-antigen ligase family protein n=1 Tax=Alkalihalobacillus sp. LMS39 TaxID=2924032 RepID=UPI001FB51A2E|nr:O-antigen ligase family protein [Alkalihalobacillus sp. LMS39]UOE93862.1 O-antigen ligase family protein [Alkalihalobacillus sp. LMS39]